MAAPAAAAAVAAAAARPQLKAAPAQPGDAGRGARALGWRGFNGWLPHTLDVIEHLGGPAASAASIGAVNGVVLRDGQLISENTDGQGLLAALRGDRPGATDPAGQQPMRFGAGPAARAITAELALGGAAGATIVDRDRARGDCGACGARGAASGLAAAAFGNAFFVTAVNFSVPRPSA